MVDTPIGNWANLDRVTPRKKKHFYMLLPANNAAVVALVIVRWEQYYMTSLMDVQKARLRDLYCVSSLQQSPIRCPTSSPRNHIMAFRALAQCARNGTQRSVLSRLVGLTDAETPAMTNIMRTLQTSRHVSPISLCSQSIRVYGLR